MLSPEPFSVGNYGEVRTLMSWALNIADCQIIPLQGESVKADHWF